MNKETLLQQTHEDYNKMIAAMANAINAINDAKDIISKLSPHSAGTILINMKNMNLEMGNMSAALAKDYLDELDYIRKNNN